MCVTLLRFEASQFSIRLILLLEHTHRHAIISWVTMSSLCFELNTPKTTNNVLRALKVDVLQHQPMKRPLTTSPNYRHTAKRALPFYHPIKHLAAKLFWSRAYLYNLLRKLWLLCKSFCQKKWTCPMGEHNKQKNPLVWRWLSPALSSR